MMEYFDKIEPEIIEENIFKLIGKQWMLVCAGNADNYNMMTASWGTMGVLWNKPIVQVFIRPQRYTYGFVENNDSFTLNFFDESFRKLLNKLGTESGRDLDKMAISDLTSIKTPKESIGFKEASMIVECQKIYWEKLNPERFLSPEIELLYSQKDYHALFIGEISNVWKQTNPSK